MYKQEIVQQTYSFCRFLLGFNCCAVFFSNHQSWNLLKDCADEETDGGTQPQTEES